MAQGLGHYEPFNDVPEMMKLNIALNEKQIVGSRPLWLDRIGQNEQDEYFEQERTLEASEAELKVRLAHHNSLKDYTRYSVNQILRLEFGRELDADDIVCTSRHTFKVGTRHVVQEDTRSLTEQFIFGLHEEGQRAEISINGHDLPSDLDQQWLEEVLVRDARAAYGDEFRAVYQRADVMDAMKNALRERLLLSALAARYQGHISSDDNLSRVQRAVRGDSAFVIDGVRLIDNTRPLLQVLVIGIRQGNEDGLFLYAPGSPGGQTWYECRTMRQLSITVIDWTKEQKGRDYLASRVHALNRDEIAGFLKRVEQMPSVWGGIILATTPYVGDEALNGIVDNTRAWLVSEEESQTPYGYRTALSVQRQSFARISCELKALQTLAVREGGFIPYEKFCFDLIKERVEQVLSDRGEQASVNPDRILVDLSPDVHMTLTELIVSETHFYAQDAGAPWSYPRFTLAHDHPPITQLDIRHIASWSRTLRPGEKYIEMLRSNHLDRTHPEGALKRLIHIEVTRRQMKVGVMHERFQGRLTAVQYQELMKVVDALETIDMRATNPIGEYPSEVFHSATFEFHLRDRLLIGVFVFRLVIGERIEQFLFTPDAPDGRSVRPLSEFIPGVKKSGLGQYFYERVRYKDQRVVGTYITDLEQLAHFTEAPVLSRNSRVKDLGSSYDNLIYRTISDVDEKTESLNEIMFKLVFNAVEAAATLISAVIPPVGIALSVALLTKNLLEGAEAYKDGDRETAQGHFLDALIELASLGKAGYSELAPTKLQKDIVGLLGDLYTIEKFFSQATGQKRLHSRALEAIQAILDDPESVTSKTNFR